MKLRLAVDPLVPKNVSLGEKLDRQGGRIFLIRSLAAESPRKNAFIYGGLASERLYVESDPIGLYGGSYSTYAYASSNPVSLRDSLGLAGGDEDEEEETPAYASPIVELQYLTLISQIQEYDPGFEDEGYRAPNDPINESEIARLQQELDDLKYGDVCPKPGTSSQIRRKPGSLGLFKGTDALRAENNMARDAATAAGPNQDQAQELHQEISGENLTYAEIMEIAMSIKNGK